MKKQFLLIPLLFFFLFTTNILYAQTGVAINTDGSDADGSAMLDVQSNAKGVLIPRMLQSQRTAISSPANGLLVYQTDGAAGFYYNSGTSALPAWTYLQNSGDANVTTQGNTFNGANQLVQLNATGQLPAVSGVNVTALNASNLASGTVPTARLGSGTASATTFLRGDNTWATAGGGNPSIKNENSNYSILSTDDIIFTDNDNTVFTLPLAAAAGAGKILYISTSTTSGTGQFTVNTSGGETVSDLVQGGYKTSLSRFGTMLASDGVSKWIELSGN